MTDYYCPSYSVANLTQKEMMAINHKIDLFCQYGCTVKPAFPVTPSFPFVIIPLYLTNNKQALARSGQQPPNYQLYTSIKRPLTSETGLFHIFEFCTNAGQYLRVTQETFASPQPGSFHLIFAFSTTVIGEKAQLDYPITIQLYRL